MWDSLADMARDTGFSYPAVAKWAQRGRIPSDAWEAIIAAALQRGHVITHADISQANAPRQNAVEARIT